MSTSVTLPDNTLQFIAKSPEEIRLEREIASLEAELDHANRICERRHDYLEMIDWTAMSSDDREIAQDYTDCLHCRMYELQHLISHTADKLGEAYLDNPLNW
jgi:hypothetical protein